MEWQQIDIQMSEQSIDFDLFLQSQGHNHPLAIPILIAEFYAQVYSLIASLFPSQRDIEAASQAAIESLALNLTEYQPGTNFKIWLFSRVVRMEKTYWSNSVKPAQPIARDENSLKDLIFCLPWEYRSPLVLRYVHQLTLPEIAQIVGMQPEKAREYLQQARYEIQALHQPGLSAPWESYHSEFRDLIADRLDDEISKGQLATLNRHLAACSRCAEYFAELEKLHTALQAKLPALWPLADIGESQLERVTKKILDRMHQKRVFLRSARYLKESGLYLIPVGVLILVVWASNYFSTSDRLVATPNAAQVRSVNTPLPTGPNQPAPQVIQVLARRSPPGFVDVLQAAW